MSAGVVRALSPSGPAGQIELVVWENREGIVRDF